MRFLKLYSSVDGSIIIINSMHIVSLADNPREGASIKLSTGQHFYVTESVSEICEMLSQ